jgi:hypothetical protein
MPNWFHNDCTVTGPESDIKAMLALMVVKRDDEDDFDFNHLIPMPQELRDLTLTYGNSGEVVNHGNQLDGDDLVPVEKEKLDDWRARYGATNWYEWACNNWGTKWNACEFSMEEYSGGSTARFSFDTAWSFPEPIAKRLSQRFPMLHFAWKLYDEAECQDENYTGWACEYHGGNIVNF